MLRRLLAIGVLVSTAGTGGCASQRLAPTVADRPATHAPAPDAAKPVSFGVTAPRAARPAKQASTLRRASATGHERVRPTAVPIPRRSWPQLVPDYPSLQVEAAR